MKKNNKKKTITKLSDLDLIELRDNFYNFAFALDFYVKYKEIYERENKK